MKNVIDELKASTVLTRHEIERIKLYVVKKYPNNSSKENASILSRTMYEILDKNLEGIDRQQKQNIKKNIMQSTILKDKENILKWDVFSAYIIQAEENPQLKISLIEWINKNQKNIVSQESLEQYVELLNDTSDIENLLYLGIKLPHKYQVGPTYKINLKSVIVNYKVALSLLTLLILSLYYLNNDINVNKIVEEKSESSQIYVSNIEKYDLYFTDSMSYHPHLPVYFNYKTIDKGKLWSFLNGKNSLLAEEPYFSSIIRTSKEFNLNPHILFAITGQEQSFVPKSHDYAEKIANNPFNVFHSWKEYNTNINDSSRIVARTVINLSKDKPIDIDIFDWINTKYAYDKNWGRGVREIFKMLNEPLYDFHVKK